MITEDNRRQYDRLARCLFAAHLSCSHGIGLDYAYKTYAKDAKVGDYWYLLAQKVEQDMLSVMDSLLASVIPDEGKGPIQ